jgi:hypothetical protein
MNLNALEKNSEGRVKCMNPKCDNAALVGWHTKLLCGDCIAKMFKLQAEQTEKILQEIS